MPDNFREPTRTMGPRSPGSDHSHPLSLVVKSGDDSNSFVHKKRVVENKLGSSRLHQISNDHSSMPPSGGVSDTTSGFSSDTSIGETRTSPVSIYVTGNTQTYNRLREEPQDFSIERFVEHSTTNRRNVRNPSSEDSEHRKSKEWVSQIESDTHKETVDQNLPLPLIVNRRSFNDVGESNDGSNTTFSKNSSGYISPNEDSGHDGELEDNLDTSGSSSPVLQHGKYITNQEVEHKRDSKLSFQKNVYSKEKELVIPEVSLERKVNLVNSRTDVNLSTFEADTEKRNSIQPNVTIQKVISKETSSEDTRSNASSNDTSSKEFDPPKRTGEQRIGIKIKEFAKFDTEVADAKEMERQILGPNTKYEQTLAALTGMSKRTAPSAPDNKDTIDVFQMKAREMERCPRPSIMNANTMEGRSRNVEEDFDIRSEVSSIDTWMSSTSYYSYMKSQSSSNTEMEDGKIHMHPHNGVFQCSYCDKTFPNAYHLNSHLVTHTGERSFSCLYCDKSFGRRSTLRAHMTTHSKTSNFMCPVCEKACNDNNSLEEHIRMHTGEKPFICTVCNKAYARKSHLSVHYRVHTGERPFVCVDCGKDFTEKRFLNDHMQTSHSGGAGGNDSGPLKCPNCYREFAYKTSLKQHLKKQMCVRNLARGGGNTNLQGNHAKQFACPFCDKSYSWKQTLKQHVSMYHRNKVHTDEFWKYEMAKHRRTVVDDKDRNDDMWQQQLGKHGKDIESRSVASGQNGYGGEAMHLSKTDPSHDERWLQQIKRATTKETHDKAMQQPLTDVKLLALQSLQSSLHNLKSNIYTNGNVKEERPQVVRKESVTLTPKHQEHKEEDNDRNQASNNQSNHKRNQFLAESGLPYTFNKVSQEQDDNYLTLLAHLSTQRKACEEQGTLNIMHMEKVTEAPMEVDESIVSRDKSNNQYQAPSQHSESLCSRQRPMAQDQRSSSNSPPTLSLPDIKEESSVTRTKMWLAQLGQYRQKAVQDEMEKSHDELWEEQISRAKSSPSKSNIEPLEITIEDERRSTKNSIKSTQRHSIQSRQEKHPPLLSALQVQPAPNRASPQISIPNFSLKSNDEDKRDDVPYKKMTITTVSSPSHVNERMNNNSPSLSTRSSIEKMTPPLPATSPVVSNPLSKDSVSFKNLLSINPSIIVNINGQNVNMRGSSVDNNEENTEKPLSLKSFGGRISLSTPTEANNNEPLIQQERQSIQEENTGIHPRHIPLAIPPLQPSSHMLPVAKYKNEKSSNVNQNGEKDGNSINSDALKNIDDNQNSKPKYPPPDPSTFGSSSVLKMLLMDPSARKRPLSPPPSPVQNKRSPKAFSNKLIESPLNNAGNEKSTESANAFNKFFGAPNTCDETDILRRRLLGIRDPAPPTTPQNKTAKMLMPKPKYSPPSATITSADVARKEPNLFPKKSPMAVEEFTKVAAAAATLASFNLSRLDENHINQQNLDNHRMTKKVNFPIEVNYENYNQQHENSLSPQRFPFFQPVTQQQQSNLLLENDLKNSEMNNVMPNSKESNDTNNVTKPLPTEPLTQERISSSPYRKSQDSDYNDLIEKKNKSSLEESNTSAYARTSVSKQLLYRYTTHNNNNINNNCDEDVNYNPSRRTSQ